MKTSILASRSASVCAVAAACVLAACSSAVTPSKLQQVHNGMKPEQVAALLGQPVRVDHAEITGLTGDVYYYPAATGRAKVVFVDDAVFTTGFIPPSPRSL
jgi:outer membrane protein assembly factor BamE (lipoprotein component of BamABCDE complex)